MFCPKCGNQVPDGAAFCNACGNKLEANANRYTFVWKKAVEKNLKKLAEHLMLHNHLINNFG